MAEPTLPYHAPDGRDSGTAPPLALLYFDPNPTTSKLVVSGLQLAGYEVLPSQTTEEAVALARSRGPAGDGSIVALLLDTSTAPTVSADVLRALLDVPGAASLPGILLVSASNPAPFPGAERLPSLRRPFTTPALVRILRETLEHTPQQPIPSTRTTMADHLLAVELALLECFPELNLDGDNVRHFADLLNQVAELPTLAVGVSLQADLAGTRLDSLLELLDRDRAHGVLTVRRDDQWLRIHVDAGRIPLAETNLDDPSLQLRRFLIDLDTPSALAAAELLAADDPLARGAALRVVEDTSIRPEELQAALMHQARELVCHALAWNSGCASFAPAQAPHPVVARLHPRRGELRICETILLGLRRREAQAEMGALMPGLDDVYVRVDAEVAKLGRHAFTRDELSVLELLNGRNTVKDVARKTQTGTFAVAKTLFRLARSGLARRRPSAVIARG